MTARIYWYPESGGALRELDLGVYWSELLEGDTSDHATSRTSDGQRTMTTYASSRTLRARRRDLSAIDGPTVIRELWAIGNHLRRNGVIALAEDEGCTWGGYAREPLVRGATSIPIASNLWALWDTPTLGAGSEVIIYGGSTEGRWERQTIDSISSSGRRVTLSSGLRYDYQDEPWVHVRDARFWPFVRLGDGATGEPILTTDHRVTYDLELRLEEHVAQLASGATAEGQYRGTSGPGLAYPEQLSGALLDREPLELASGVKL